MPICSEDDILKKQTLIVAKTLIVAASDKSPGRGPATKAALLPMIESFNGGRDSDRDCLTLTAD